MAAKIISRGKTPQTIEALLRNVEIVKKTPKNGEAFVQHYKTEKFSVCVRTFSAGCSLRAGGSDTVCGRANLLPGA